MKISNQRAINLAEIIATIALVAVIAAGLYAAWCMVVHLLNG